MALRPAERERGLAPLNEARQTRRRAIVLGRVRMRDAAPRFWGLTIVGIVLFTGIYYRCFESRVDEQKAELGRRQRATAVALGDAAPALRDKLEGWVLELASMPLPSPTVSHELSLGALANGPGIYLRLPRSEAVDAARIRKAAAASMHDGFTACLFVGRAGDPMQGTPCKATSQCGPGELCNEWSVCAVPSQPYNARLLYEALRVVGPEWTQALEQARDDLQVRAMELDLEDASKHEVVAAAELARRSKYFTAVLDEAPDGAVPEPLADESPAEGLQAVDHFVRVGVWDLERGTLALAARVEAAASLRGGATPRGTIPAEVRRAQQRQANSCAAADDIRELLEGTLASDAAPAGVDGSGAAFGAPATVR